MRSKNTQRMHLSKTTRSEILIARLSLPFVTLVLFLVMISLGSRSPLDTQSSFEKTMTIAAQKIRGWEELASNGKKQSNSDGRSNAGFHFQWPQTFTPPEFDTPRNTPDRIELIKKAIVLGKSKIHVENELNDDRMAWIEEPLNPAREVLLRKKVIILLPGESLKLKTYPHSSSPRTWLLRVRAAAVTQDRLDAPLPMNVGFSEENTSKSEIDPHGQHFDLPIPTLGEIQKNKPNDFRIEWPVTNSGVLLIDGLKPDDETHAGTPKTHKNLIVHIDQLGTTIAGLKKTIKTIKELSSDQQGTILIGNAIPSSAEDKISKESILSNRNPIDLGATVSNPHLQSLISRNYLLVDRAIQKGGSARRVILNSGVTCQPDCTSRQKSTKTPSEFTTTLIINRREEFESTKRFIRNDEFITQPGLLYVEINNPPETLRLNSETKRFSQFSFFSWMYSGLLKPLGYINTALQFEEKTAQLDNWLAKLMESFLVTSHSANIALVLHDNSQPISLNHDKFKTSLTRGEILLHLNELSDESDHKEDTHSFDEAVSSLSVMRIFGKRAFSSEKVSEMEEFIPELKVDAIAVNQLQQNQLVTLTPAGWLIDPIMNSEPAAHNYMAIAPPDKIHEIQEISNAMRKRNQLMSVNIAFPGSNRMDETLETVMTTSLVPIGCETTNKDILMRNGPDEPNHSQRQVIFKGHREASTLWQIRCLLDGRISTHSHLKLRFSINGQPVSRDSFALGEYLHPVRGFLWHSPDSLELTGAQILEATSALSSPRLNTNTHTKVIIWTDRFPTSADSSLPVIAYTNDPESLSQGERDNLDNRNKLSERK